MLQTSLLLLMLFGTPSQPQPAATPSHALWDQLLRTHVTAAGKVNYKGFIAEKAKLQSYLDLLAQQTPDAGWSRSEKLAYWINAYNAFTVKLIIDHYPTASITKLDKPWDQKFIKLGTAYYSLNDIEHNILRKDFQEPRIHFAVNCASRSCPVLLNRAFQPATIDAQLEQQAKAFINSPTHNTLQPGAAALSEIFNWYQADFIKQGTLIAFINRYAAVKLNAQATISYKTYDWSLNE